MDRFLESARFRTRSLTKSLVVPKSRRPRFELTLRILDLNNVPLVVGTAYVKWNLSVSAAAEHHGRTDKALIADHQASWAYVKCIPIRMTVGRDGMLQNCDMQFEIVQEFSDPPGTGGGGRSSSREGNGAQTSAGAMRPSSDGASENGGGEHAGTETDEGPGSRRPSHVFSERRRSSVATDRTRSRSREKTTPAAVIGLGGVVHNAAGLAKADRTVLGRIRLNLAEYVNAAQEEEGVVRRYLMQDSKINSTLRIGIHMRQLDGDGNFTTPPLKSSSVFGGITGVIADQNEPDEAGRLLSINPQLQHARAGARSNSTTTTTARRRSSATPTAPATTTPASPHTPLDPNASPTSTTATTTTTATRTDAGDLQDMYRRTLAASYVCRRDEYAPDELVEDIFSGGDGFRDGWEAFARRLAEEEGPGGRAQRGAGLGGGAGVTGYQVYRRDYQGPLHAGAGGNGSGSGHGHARGDSGTGTPTGGEQRTDRERERGEGSGYHSDESKGPGSVLRRHQGVVRHRPRRSREIDVPPSPRNAEGGGGGGGGGDGERGREGARDRREKKAFGEVSEFEVRPDLRSWSIAAG